MVTFWPPSWLLRFVLRGRARAARREHRFADAAVLYEELAWVTPDDPSVRIQSGHMRKEAGDLVAAHAHYRRADAALAQADAGSNAGRERLRQEVRRELRHLPAAGWRSADPPAPAPSAPAPDPDSCHDTGDLDRLAPELAPRDPAALARDYPLGITIRRLGRREPSAWGNLITMRGVEAVRGFCISPVPVREVAVLIDGMAVLRQPVRGGYPLKFARDPAGALKYVFNAWYDFGSFAPGRYRLEVRCTDEAGDTHSFHDVVLNRSALDPADARSDGVVPVVEPDPDRLAALIRAAPSIVHSAKRALFPDGVRSVLVMRTDQLGDMVASIPALRRLRELVPDARIVGLLTSANRELAQTLDLFDEIVTIDFPDDPVEERRLMPLAEQEALRRWLAPYRFDVAIDLADSDVSRPLLRLAGARFTHGTAGGDWPWLTSQMRHEVRDRWNGMSAVPHGAKALALVEALGAVLHPHAPVIRRPDLGWDRVAPFGLEEGQRFVVLHGGARIGFSRWPYFAQLARLLLDRTDLRVVMIAGEEGGGPPAELARSPRFRWVGERLPFDQFDALLSHATVVVGNDSGPKHLAALRGTDVVTIHAARINWAEWGQEEVGAIITRRVPCQGCAIFHQPEECGRDFACVVDIRPEEVFAAVAAFLPGSLSDRTMPATD